MIPQGILAQLMANQGQSQTGAPQNPGMLLGGQPMQMPQNPNGGSAMAAPQATASGATGAAPAQGQQGLLPNMTSPQANAISTGLNMAAANMPHAANQAAPTTGLTSQGVMNALGSGMGGGMLSPQLIQLLRQGGGNGTA